MNFDYDPYEEREKEEPEYDAWDEMKEEFIIKAHDIAEGRKPMPEHASQMLREKVASIEDEDYEIILSPLFHFVPTNCNDCRFFDRYRHKDEVTDIEYFGVCQIGEFSVDKAQYPNDGICPINRRKKNERK